MFIIAKIFFYKCPLNLNACLSGISYFLKRRICLSLIWDIICNKNSCRESVQNFYLHFSHLICGSPHFTLTLPLHTLIPRIRPPFPCDLLLEWYSITHSLGTPFFTPTYHAGCMSEFSTGFGNPNTIPRTPQSS